MLERELVKNSNINMNNRNRVIKRIMPQLEKIQTERDFDMLLRAELSKEYITAVQLENIIANLKKS
jgi:hypothetical protein